MKRDKKKTKVEYYSTDFLIKIFCSEDRPERDRGDRSERFGGDRREGGGGGPPATSLKPQPPTDILFRLIILLSLHAHPHPRVQLFQ